MKHFVSFYRKNISNNYREYIPIISVNLSLKGIYLKKFLNEFYTDVIKKETKKEIKDISITCLLIDRVKIKDKDYLLFENIQKKDNIYNTYILIDDNYHSTIGELYNIYARTSNIENFDKDYIFEFFDKKNITFIKYSSINTYRP